MKQYLPLKSKSLELGDEYYRCLAESLSRKKERAIEECLKIGRQYKSALEQQLMDLKRFADPNFVERERQLVDQYLQLIEHDLSSLTQGQIDQLLNRQKPKFDQ